MCMARSSAAGCWRSTKRDNARTPLGDRYAAEKGNFVLVVGPHNGLGARSAPKDAGLTSRGPLPGPGSPTRVFGALGWKISRGGAPRLVRPSVGPHLKMRPTKELVSTE